MSDDKDEVITTLKDKLIARGDEIGLLLRERAKQEQAIAEIRECRDALSFDSKNLRAQLKLTEEHLESCRKKNDDLLDKLKEARKNIIWRCTCCSAILTNELDPAWQWDGEAWQHRCDPQYLHSIAEMVTPKWLENRVKELLDHERERTGKLQVIIEAGDEQLREMDNELRKCKASFVTLKAQILDDISYTGDDYLTKTDIVNILTHKFAAHIKDKDATNTKPSVWRLMRSESPNNWQPVREADGSIAHYPTREAAEAAIPKGLDAEEWGGEYKTVEVKR